MPIRVTCPGCGFSGDVPESKGGTRVRCSHCGSAVGVPLPIEADEQTRLLTDRHGVGKPLPQEHRGRRQPTPRARPVQSHPAPERGDIHVYPPGHQESAGNAFAGGLGRGIGIALGIAFVCLGLPTALLVGLGLLGAAVGPDTSPAPLTGTGIPTQQDALQLVEFEWKLAEANTAYHIATWKFSVRNSGPRVETCIAQVTFLDADGFELYQDEWRDADYGKTIAVEAGHTITRSGRSWIDNDVWPSVASAEILILPSR